MDLPLPWRESFAVGHPVLDAEHQRMVALINDVISAIEKTPERIPDLLTKLRTATREHVQNENALLWELRSGTYAALQGRARTAPFLKAMAEAAFDEHMAEHDMWLGRIDDTHDLPPDTLAETLKSWFLDHAIKHDSKLKAIFQAM
ncbi:MAG TPA: hemerythrin domain-containing protein [Stellaceae bacterium]|nr:hemerythrin domain-containing protein [Stellaceae bacterium]